ncbi:hypothetical protein QT231_22710 [Halomonas sp. SpR1]|uniref:hypothetical protein n=1 Tax=Halomonas sp. SpR1 TaxID=3050462 RepID=UPI0027E46F47|nr:hypothetical protein [Halomonas sp. SpR1]MDQ7735521.1 hypothetical protein [Halomonas sp. SpR1]
MSNATRLTVHMPARSVTVHLPAPQRFQVLSHGTQGPPGTLSPEILAQVDEARHATQKLGSMMAALTDAISHHGGMIAAQEDATP